MFITFKKCSHVQTICSWHLRKCSYDEKNCLCIVKKYLIPLKNHDIEKCAFIPNMLHDFWRNMHEMLKKFHMVFEKNYITYKKVSGIA